MSVSGFDERFDDYLITLDVDWASDEVVDATADLLVEAGVRATWFVTHDSPATRRLAARSDLFEVGLHPNFLPGSTHGATPRDVLTHLSGLAPTARTVWTHSLHQSTPILALMASEFGIRHDLSIFLPGTPFISPHTFFVLPGTPLLRLPYFWEDDHEMHLSAPEFSFAAPRHHVPGLKPRDGEIDPFVGIPGQVASRSGSTGKVLVVTGEGLLALEIVERRTGARERAADVIRTIRTRLGMDLAGEVARLSREVELLRLRVDRESPGDAREGTT